MFAAECFGNNLRSVREISGMSQLALARAVDIHPSQISHYERNVSFPQLDNFCDICNVLNVKPGALLGDYR